MSKEKPTLQDLEKRILQLENENRLLCREHSISIQKLADYEDTNFLILKNSPDGLFITELNQDNTLGKFLLVNETACKWLEYTLPELLKKTPFEINSEVSKHWYPQRIQKIMTNGHLTAEAELITSNGIIIPVELNSQITLYRNQPVLYSIARNIKHSSSLLRLSRQLESARSYEEIMNLALSEVKNTLGYQTLIVYTLTNDKKRFKALMAGGSISDAFMSEEKTSSIQIEGDQMLEEIVNSKEIVIVEDAQTDHRVNRDIVVRFGLRTIVNVPVILFDQHLGAIITCSLMEEGVHIPTTSEQKYLMTLASHMAASLGKIRFVTERNQAEALLHKRNEQIKAQNVEYIRLNKELTQNNQELKITKQKVEEREEKFRLMIKNSNDSFVLINQEGEQIYISDAAERDTGYSIKELLGPLQNVIYPSDLDNVLVAWNKVLTTKGEIARVQYRHKHKHKKYIWYEAVAQNFIDNPAIKAVVVNVRDITLMKETEKALKKAKEKAEESDRLKTAFLQNLSHEIRTPMNAIMGFSSLIPDSFNNKSKLEKYSRIIGQRCCDLLDIINDILDIAKIESGQLSVNNEECDLSQLFNDLTPFFKEYQNRINKQHVSLIISCLDSPSENLIMTDKGKLKQILINLLSNAFKFTDEGKIEAGYRYDKDNRLHFFVSDTGIGIPSSKQKEVFERFIQLNHNSRTNIGGTGLGLSIVKGLVHLLGGTISLKSTLGLGSTFSFTINYKSISSLQNKRSTFELSTIKLLPNKTILIVEDDYYNAEYLREILSRTEMEILYAENGNSAVSQSLSQNIDLILMDIRLPDMDGYEATRLIKLHKPTLKIIAQTAYASSDEKEKALNAGCCDYISKPTKKDTLLEIIHKHMISS